LGVKLNIKSGEIL